MITDVGIKMLLIIKSANATLTINALPEKIRDLCVYKCNHVNVNIFISKTFYFVSENCMQKLV